MATAARPHASATLTGVAVGIVVATFVGAIALLNSDGPHLVPGWVGVLPLFCLVALPAALAAIGLRRPAALLAAGALSLPVAFLSFGGVTLPLLIPAAFYFVAYGRAPRVRPRVPAVLIAILVVAGSVASFVVTLATAQPVCGETIAYRDGRRVERTTEEDGLRTVGAGGANDRARVVETRCSEAEPTLAGSALSLGTIVITAWGAVWMSRPRRSE